METVPRGGISVAVVSRFVDVATDALAQAREEIDALNVFPVPDGDTGTNMFLTISGARDALVEAIAAGGDTPTVLRAFTRGALLSARGNSGVIVSQLLGALIDRILRAERSERNASVMAAAMREASDAAYAAVGDPKEGTILSVARAAADGAQSSADRPGARAREVFAAAAAAARAALLETPRQLQVLADAGVVDAGGRGLSVILDAAETVLTGRRMRATSRGRTIPTPHLPQAASPAAGVQIAGSEGTGVGLPSMPGGDLSADGPAYEVMYLLDLDDSQTTGTASRNAQPDSIKALKTALTALGDSLVVVGGGSLWNVHIHTDEVGAAIEAGIVAGRPHRIRVTHFADQIGTRKQPVSGRAVVAVAAGPGLRRLFEECGAVVIDGGPGQRPSTGMLLEAMRESGAAEIVVLPNDSDTIRVAEIAARTAEAGDGGQASLQVSVIPTRTQVEGIAALAVHEPGRTFAADVTEMTATARHVRSGAVTVAAKAAMTMAGPCQPGDVLGVISGEFVIVGSDLAEVAATLTDRLLGGGGELVTLVAGAEAGDLLERCSAHLAQAHPHVDVVVFDGGQPRYPLLLSVE